MPRLDHDLFSRSPTRNVLEVFSTHFEPSLFNSSYIKRP